MSYESILADIKEKNFSELPFALSHAELDHAAQVFLDFLTLPQEEKETLVGLVSEDNPESEVGYRRRDERMGKDNKEFFHYHAVISEMFSSFEQSEKTVAFLNEARKVYDSAAESLRALLEVFEEKYPGITQKFFPSNTHPELYLRFLKYDTTELGDFLAKAHYDRGTLTLALAESAPGLRIGRDDESLTPVLHKDGQAVFMPGYNFHEITSKEFTPTWHDVVQSENARVTAVTSRWAIVLFADAVGMRGPTEEAAHTVIRPEEL